MSITVNPLYIIAVFAGAAFGWQYAFYVAVLATTAMTVIQWRAHKSHEAKRANLGSRLIREEEREANASAWRDQGYV